MAKRLKKEGVSAPSITDKVLEYAEAVFKAPVNDQKTILFVVDGKSIFGFWTLSRALTAKKAVDPNPKVWKVTKEGDKLTKKEI